MSSYTRSITLTSAMLLAVIAAMLVGATPQTTQTPRPKTTGTPAPIRDEAAAPPAVSPISLSDADGQELILEDLSARTAIQGPLSLTELEFRFRNPRDRRIEGRFACTLPPNAAISRFAKEVNGQLMEGEVVERLRANQVYEQFLHQMRDPALLEQDLGNRFSARIFPIEARASVRILLSYTTLLPMKGGERTYTLPLRGVAKIDHFAFRAFVTALPGEETVGLTKSQSAISGPSSASRSTADIVSLEERDYTPQRDVVLTWRPTAEASRARTLRAGDFYLAAYRPEVRLLKAMAPERGMWLFYVDTSASSAESSDHRIRALEQLFASLPPGDRVQVRAFDNDVATLGSGTAAEMSRSIGNLLRARLFLGGTDLGAMFRDAAKAAQENPDRTIVVASDLVATLGDTEAKALNDAIKTIPSNATVHALVLGSRQESTIAKALTAGRGRVVSIPFTETMDARAREAASDLRRALGQSFDVADAQAEWIYPTHFDDVQDGDEILVLGKLKAAGTPSVRVNNSEIQASAQTLPAGTFGPLLEREAYRAYLDYLVEREANEPSEAVRRALATEQVKISTEQRVVIPRTTLLVLESEWDYQRFGLDRRALAAILTIEAGGIGRVDRRTNDVTPLPPRPIPVPMRKTAASPRVQPAPAPEPGNVASGVGGAPGVAEQVEGGVEGGVVGGVVGGVAGGVVGGVAGGVPAGVADAVAPAEIPAQNAAREVAPPPPPPPAPAPPPVAPPPARVTVPRPPAPEPSRTRDEEKQDTAWLKARRATRDDAADLEKKLADDPRNRETYNQLSEAYASLGDWSALRKVALRWQPYDAENPQVYEVLGMADERLGNDAEAVRANASVLEVAAAKPELLQRGGLLLLRVGRARLAETPLRRALELRPDRVNSYRHLALMLWRDGRIEEAARVLESATRQEFPNWYGDAQRVVREELGYVYRAWIAKEPSRRHEIEDRAREYAVDLTRTDALRVTLAWETDANDVDLHVVDPSGEECFYAHPDTKSGLHLYQDITQGLGPEVIRTSKLEKGTYHVGVRYFAAGPMGVSRGIVVVMRGSGDDPGVEIYPFRLIEGGGDIRYVTAVKVQ